MRRLLFQGWDRAKRLSGAQKLRARAYWLEGMGNAMTWVVLAGVMATIYFSQRSLRETRQDRENRKAVESMEVWKARRDLPAPIKQEWELQEARVRSLEEERREFEMGVAVLIGLGVLGQVLGFMVARWYHGRADAAEGLGPYALEGPAKLLRPESPSNEPRSQ